MLMIVSQRLGHNLFLMAYPFVSESSLIKWQKQMLFSISFSFSNEEVGFQNKDDNIHKWRGTIIS